MVEVWIPCFTETQCRLITHDDGEFKVFEWGSNAWSLNKKLGDIVDSAYARAINWGSQIGLSLKECENPGSDTWPRFDRWNPKVASEFTIAKHVSRRDQNNDANGMSYAQVLRNELSLLNFYTSDFEAYETGSVEYHIMNLTTSTRSVFDYLTTLLRVSSSCRSEVPYILAVNCDTFTLEDQTCTITRDATPQLIVKWKHRGPITNKTIIGAIMTRRMLLHDDNGPITNLTQIITALFA